MGLCFGSTYLILPGSNPARSGPSVLVLQSDCDLDRFVRSLSTQSLTLRNSRLQHDHVTLAGQAKIGPPLKDFFAEIGLRCLTVEFLKSTFNASKAVVNSEDLPLHAVLDLYNDNSHRIKLEGGLVTCDPLIVDLCCGTKIGDTILVFNSVEAYELCPAKILGQRCQRIHELPFLAQLQNTGVMYSQGTLLIFNPSGPNFIGINFIVRPAFSMNLVPSKIDLRGMLITLQIGYRLVGDQILNGYNCQIQADVILTTNKNRIQTRSSVNCLWNCITLCPVLPKAETETCRDLIDSLFREGTYNVDQFQLFGPETTISNIYEEICIVYDLGTQKLQTVTLSFEVMIILTTDLKLPFRISMPYPAARRDDLEGSTTDVKRRVRLVDVIGPDQPIPSVLKQLEFSDLSIHMNTWGPEPTEYALWAGVPEDIIIRDWRLQEMSAYLQRSLHHTTLGITIEGELQLLNELQELNDFWLSYNQEHGWLLTIKIRVMSGAEFSRLFDISVQTVVAQYFRELELERTELRFDLIKETINITGWMKYGDAVFDLEVQVSSADYVTIQVYCDGTEPGRLKTLLDLFEMPGVGFKSLDNRVGFSVKNRNIGLFHYI